MKRIPKVVTWRGSLRGLSVGLLGGMMESRASRRVMPLALPSFLSTFQPLTLFCEHSISYVTNINWTRKPYLSENNGFHKSQDSVLFNKSSQYKYLSSTHQTHLVPAHVGGGLHHVVTMPSGDGHEGNGFGVVPKLWTEGYKLSLSSENNISFILRSGT